MGHYPRSNLRLAALLAIGTLALGVMMPTDRSEDSSNDTISLALELEPTSLTADNKNDPEAAAKDASSQSDNNPEHIRLSYIILQDDNLSAVFAKLNIPARDLQEILLASGSDALRRIVPGNQLNLTQNKTGQIHSLEYKIDALRTLVATRKTSGFVIETVEKPVVIVTAKHTAGISEEFPSLYKAGKQAGLSDNLIMELANLFQWDISFALDLRYGDRFSLVYQEHYVDGIKVKDGKILAAEFSNSGKKYTALLYQRDNGDNTYFSENGKSLKKAFIRDPVHFSYVSSSFNLRRLHPIHKKVRPHRGIDYAARKGTPVVAAGDGKIYQASTNEASGNFLVINHGEQYVTKYLHLSRFAKGMRAGKKVKQGQRIGYVGSTGWATGPHLHYEFLVSGVHRNPKTVGLPNADPIPDAELNTFRLQTRGYLQQLAALNKGIDQTGLDASSKTGE
jgi:murein DD-endopeptidase MepM/ murein hydrolase activator NlpD